ncbi:hypothetical protein [Thioclava sp. DLFJ4-1]|uniref:hypothetical protein n=1 Tax=Thioclava sp. DLFJ4-1 TaxID=1915313 RepID=UPI001AEFD303|nr:hypothetical protein [Thioclava sp. DLFJ4-1]
MARILNRQKTNAVDGDTASLDGLTLHEHLKEPKVYLSDVPRTPPQVIVWQAEARVLGPPLYPVKVTVDTFLMGMVRRYKMRGLLGDNDAIEAALAFMQSSDEEFGGGDFDWSDAGAAELADKDMSYWDHDEGGGRNA